MTWNCTDPLHYVENPVWQATNGVLLPVHFCFGFLGNLFILIVLNGAHMRTSNPIYVYLVGLASLDLLNLGMRIPTYLRDMEILPLERGFSEGMAYYVMLYNGFGSIVRHSEIWVVVFAALVRYFMISRPFSKRRWMRISASRIIVFLIVVACVILDFARFFEYKVTRMLQHCLPLELWTQGATVFSGGVLFVTVYPWVVTALALLLPFTLIALFCGLILIHMKIWNMTKQQIFASPKTSHDEVRTNIMLLIIIGVFVACELPNAVVYAVKDLASAATTSTAGFHNAVYITECFSLVHSSLNFVLYTVLSPDFRKTMKRMFCRLCIRDDEYYEPVVCCGACRERNTSSRSSTKSSSSDVTETSNKTPTAAPDAYDSDGDIWV